LFEGDTIPGAGHGVLPCGGQADTRKAVQGSNHAIGISSHCVAAFRVVPAIPSLDGHRNDGRRRYESGDEWAVERDIPDGVFLSPAPGHRVDLGGIMLS
jgi:hypothetical protein